MRIEPPWSGNEAAGFVSSTLEAVGHRALIVGGAVRNAVLGLPAGDIDVATDVPPETVVEVFSGTDAGLRTFGLKFGTVLIIRRGIPIEVTSFRKDIETDGRHARVVYTDRVEEDARRRDFTINAIYAEFDGTIVDPLDGFEDLLARRVRFVGAAAQRIREDRLRMLRFFRFHALIGDQSRGMDEAALAAVSEHSEGIRIVSAERVTSELLGLLGAATPSQSVSGMAGTGLLEEVLPGANPDPLSGLEELERRCNVAPSPLRRLALLGGNMERLRLDRRSTARLDRLTAGSHEDAEVLGYLFGREDGLDMALLTAARTDLVPPPDLVDRINSGASRRFPVKACQLPQELKGKAVGQALRELEKKWMESGFQLTAKDLLMPTGNQPTPEDLAGHRQQGSG